MGIACDFVVGRECGCGGRGVAGAHRGVAGGVAGDVAGGVVGEGL